MCGGSVGYAQQFIGGRRGGTVYRDKATFSRRCRKNRDYSALTATEVPAVGFEPTTRVREQFLRLPRIPFRHAGVGCAGPVQYSRRSPRASSGPTGEQAQAEGCVCVCGSRQSRSRVARNGC